MEKYLYSVKFYIFSGILALALGLSIAAFSQGSPSLYETLTYILLMAYSLITIHRFIYNREMRLGGFSLKANEQVALRVFFFVFAIVVWLIAVSFIFSVA